MKYYAGIGSRDTPPDVLERMTQFAAKLEARGWTLRSGGAPGADTAFSSGVTRKQIYLPWPGFNPDETGTDFTRDWAASVAAKFHPVWPRLSSAVRRLMARNVCQILGQYDGAPVSKFVVCWTKGAKGGGGTGQALRIARAYNVPVFDLASDGVAERFAARYLS